MNVPIRWNLLKSISERPGLCDKLNMPVSFTRSCGVDPHSCADSGGDDNRLLLHAGAAAPGSHSLLHPGLEVVDPGRVFALLRLLPHCMVRCRVINEQIKARVAAWTGNRCLKVAWILLTTDISHRWFHESSRWLVLSNKSEQAITNLKSVANFNGRREEGEKIDMKVSGSVLLFVLLSVLKKTKQLGLRERSLYVQMVQESMKKEMSGSKGSYSVLDLFRTPTMRSMTVCLSAVW